VGEGRRTCVVSQYVGANTPVLYVYLLLYNNVDDMFDVVFTKLNFSSGNYAVEFAYGVRTLSQMPR